MSHALHHTYSTKLTRFKSGSEALKFDVFRGSAQRAVLHALVVQGAACHGGCFGIVAAVCMCVLCVYVHIYIYIDVYVYVYINV